MSTLRRRESLRDSTARRMREEGRYTTFEKKRIGGRVVWKPKLRKPLKKQSRSQKERLRKYYAVRGEFLRDPANALCAICLCRGRNPAPATEVHHCRGRAGSLIADARYFIASCNDCREFPHEHPREARELGILADPGDWNRSEKNAARPATEGK